MVAKMTPAASSCVVMGDKLNHIQIICDECDSADHP